MSNVMDAFSLKGKVAIVTGGAGSFGKQILEAIAQAERCDICCIQKS